MVELNGILMMESKDLIWSCVLFLFLFSCEGNKNMNALEVREARFCSVADSLLTPQERKQKMDYLYYVPDSVLTFEQSAIKKELIKTFKEEVATKYVKVENNEMTFTMGKKEFLKTGLPETLYWEIKENIKTNNRFIKENGMVDIEESWQKTLDGL